MIKVGVIGATGYAGVELARLLLGHSKVELACMSSVSYVGEKLEDVYPNMTGFTSLPLLDSEDVIEKSDVIFLGLPHGHSQEAAQKAIAAGKKVIDMGADFRLSAKDYKDWYDGEVLDAKLSEQAVYGIPELYRDEIIGKSLVANPGCYPTSAILALAPLLKFTKVEKNSIIIDAKSGATGAGRSASDMTHFPNCNENLIPYNIGKHRHTPEIEQGIKKISGEDHLITFTPHLLPVNRGILNTIYATPINDISLLELHKFATDFYVKEKFVRVLGLGKTAALNQVVHSNYCNISFHEDRRTGKVIIISALDNMIKGAAGQGIQNMNIICGFDESEGLTMLPPAF